MAKWLAERGHEVKAVTAPPYYPEWRIGKGYSAYSYRSEYIDGVEVLRCPLWVPARPSGLKRLVHLMSFTLSSFPVVLSQIFWRPDVVLVVEPPFFCAPQSWLTARLSGAKAWLHMQDFEIDAAFDLGLLPQGFIRNIVQTVERLIMKRFDRISTISERMLDSLNVKGIAAKQSILFQNWVDTELIYPLEKPSVMRDELGIPESAVIVLYSGNMGVKQGLEIVIESAKILENRKDIFFMLCGDGAARQRLSEIASGLSNISFMPLQPVERLNELLNMADIHILPQRADATDLVMPSKLTCMFASGRPVIATALEGTQLARVVEGRGIVVNPGDAEGFAKSVTDLVCDPSMRHRLGRMAREYAVANWSKDAILRQFEKDLIRCVEER